MIEPDPWLWSAVHLALAGPALAVAHGRRARSPAQLVVGGALLLLSLVAIVVARQTPVIAPPFVEPWFGVPLPGP